MWPVVEASPPMPLCHQAWLCPPLIVTPVLLGMGSQCSCQLSTSTSLSITHVPQQPGLLHAVCPVPIPSTALGKFPYSTAHGRIDITISMVMMKAPVLCCCHPIRASRNQASDRGGELPAMLCAALEEMSPTSLLKKGDGHTTSPSPVPVECLAPPGFGFPHVPAIVFWEHRIIEP